MGGRQPDPLRDRTVRLDPGERVPAEHGPPQPERAHLPQRELGPRALRGEQQHVRAPPAHAREVRLERGSGGGGGERVQPTTPPTPKPPPARTAPPPPPNPCGWDEIRPPVGD